MKNTTVCYLERGTQYLLLHRTKKENDENAGKWIGVGGKCEENESPEDCMLREVREETGLSVTQHRLRGVITFVSDAWEGQYMYLFTASKWHGALTDCDEGELAWVERTDMLHLPLWEGDRIFLALLAEERPFFSLKLVYQGDSLQQAVLDGTPLTL
ncbi:MAG TPA: 8-oxo-dGTP diphosphatase [Candidatus Ruthenibacterium merdavium]|uniref:8-oxo-dGTP diphosphatase n=1 Tax=Candidatus Ruthenibacterium merdavium TaxID=2838752 RepID=A0A9D2TJZ7_9FIRM|nr:8-oxo-dGTP diphosphatase [Candidatus Ruthenibacterium merdavium]